MKSPTSCCVSSLSDTSPPEWSPPLSEKGATVFNDREHRYILCSGPKQCGKTFALCHKVADHLYSNNQARVAIVVKRKKSASLGVWTHLTQDVIINQWQQYGRVLGYTRRPGMESTTKALTFSVQNAYGTQSHCYIFPVYNIKDAEEIFKNTSFSLIYINEADQFTADVFRAAADQLRSTTVPHENMQLLLDCNPPEDGVDNWLYYLFIDPPKTADKEYVGKFAVYFFTPDDNPFISDEQKREIKNTYSNDNEKYRRYWLGEWIKSTAGSLYEGVFDPNVHVIGKADPSVREEDWDVLLPNLETHEIFTSWDLGQTSHAVSIFTTRWSKEELVFDVLDEVVSIDLEIALSEVVDIVLGRMDAWEAYLKTVNPNRNVSWVHWADTSSFRFVAIANSTEAELVDQYSSGRISFRKIKKPKIDYRVDMMRRLFSQNQVFFSARCQATILAFRLLRREGLQVWTRSGRGKRLNADQRRHTHPFDALTYGISHVLPESIVERSRPSSGRIVSVRQR